MFEQESYSFDATPVEPLREGDLFYKYEVGRWSLSRRIYTILGVSALLNLAFFTVIAQTPVLTARGCDSPFVGRVCQVLDMAYVGSALFGTDREMADVEYTRTKLGEAEEVVWIDQTGITPQLQYPEGYFQLANPDQFNQQQAMLNGTDPMSNSGFNIPGIPSTMPSQPGKSLIDTPQFTPKKNKNAVIGGDLDSPFADEDTATNKGNGKADKPSKGKDPKDETTAKNDPPKVTPENGTEDESKADKFGIFINKRPLREKAQETIADVEAKKVTLDRSFKVVITGTIGLSDDKKTIILKNPKPVLDKNSAPNDPAMEELVQEWIIAVGDAGWLGYLDKLKAKQLVISVEQNDQELVASVRADQPTENTASTAASGLGALLQIAAGGAKDDEKLFLEKAEVKAEGKTFVLNFKIPKPVVQEMIKRKLDEAAAENKNTLNSNFRKDTTTAVK